MKKWYKLAKGGSYNENMHDQGFFLKESDSEDDDVVIVEDQEMKEGEDSQKEKRFGKILQKKNGVPCQTA